MTTQAAAARSRIDELIASAMPRIADVTRDLEFATFQTAARIPRDLAGAPETEREQFRYELRLALLRRLEVMWPDRRVLGVGHDVKITLLPDSPKRAALFVEPLFVAGRYRKLARGLSQTVWHCRSCRGRGGCDACGGTRRVVSEAVEEFVRNPIRDAVGARRTSFHGAGREDVDVRMLGDGRPFVVSAQWARRRSVDGERVAAAVAERSKGRVLVSDVCVVSRADMGRVTTEHGEKTYRALIRSEGGAAFPPDAAARLASLAGTEIRQRTPKRVEVRRADMVRTRGVLGIEVEEARGGEILALIRTDPGTYVKELVSGDDGRTEPSFASVLGQPCVCAELDVVSTGAAPGFTL
jgi:tRNA pseudouridine synthase 10